MNYTLREDENGNCVKWEQENGTISFIPCDESNSDYQRYLRWLENPEADEAQSL
jgi:hypothetical protein